MVIIDGDDEIVGPSAFQLINSFYQRNQSWVVYSNFFISMYTYGSSKEVSSDFFTSTTRQFNHFIGPIRTFYVELFRRIKVNDHKDENRNYL